MPSLASACNNQGKKCIYFELQRVEYNQSQCLLASNEQEIKVVIQGLRKPGRSSNHAYKMEVRETGGKSFAGFARKADPSPQSFRKGANDQTDSIDSSANLEITFLIRKAQPLSSASQQIVVHCIFGHSISRGRWCTDQHRASIVLTLV
jgi:hypothetical protein